MSHSEPPSLRSILVRLFFRRPDTETIVLDLGLDPGQIAWDERPVNTWRSILLEVDRLGRIEDLVRLADQRYPKDEQLARFIAQYRDIDWRSELYAVGRRFVWAVPDALPPNYVPRPELLAEVRQALLADAGTLALTSAVKMDALHGMGGIGKSVMARALCDDPEVQATFPDGILWARVGQTPDLIPRLREWVDALGGIISETAPTVDRLKAILADLLRERACLLIADDVWKKAHAEAFRVGGSRCRLVLTTRDAALAEDMGAAVHPIPVMAEAEAVALLSDWAGHGLGDVSSAFKTKVVRRLGRLPLAIKLAGAQLRRQDPTQWLVSFDARKLKMPRIEEIHDSLAATFALSLDNLDPIGRHLYVSLAVFKEDESIPSVGIARMWSKLDGRTADDTKELLSELSAQALLQLSRGVADVITIHDLLRDFMAAELGEDGRVATHQALLDAYRPTQNGIGWPTAPDDGYLYDHLAYHLDQLAGLDSDADIELHTLFNDDAWLHVRVRQSGYRYDGYLSDLRTVWYRELASARHWIDFHQQPSSFAVCLRYALIHTSVNSLAASYEPTLVTCSIESGVWSVSQALSMAALAPDPQHSAALFAAVLQTDRLDNDRRKLAEQLGMEAVWKVEEGSDCVKALALLIPCLEKTAQRPMIERGYAIAQAIADEEKRAEAFAALAPYLPEELQEDISKRGRAMHQVENRALVLGAIAPSLKGQLLETNWREVRAIRDEYSVALAVKCFAPRLTGRLQYEALELAHSFKWPEHRAETLVAFVPELNGEIRERTLSTALDAARQINDGLLRARAFAALTPLLTGGKRQLALHEALSASRSVTAIDRKVEALLSLARLRNELGYRQILEETLVLVRSIPDKRKRSRILGVLASQEEGAVRVQIVEEGLALGRVIDDGNSTYRELADLTEQMEKSTPQFRSADLNWWGDKSSLTEDLNHRFDMALAGPVVFEGARASVAAADKPVSKHELLDVLSRHQEWWRADGIIALAPRLDDESMLMVLTAAEAMKSEGDRVRVLSAVASRLQGGLLRQALAMARSVNASKLRDEALASITPALAMLAPREALDVARTIKNQAIRAETLISLIQHLGNDDQLAITREVLFTTKTISNEQERGRALLALVTQLRGYDVKEVLDATRSIAEERRQARLLAALVPQVPDEFLPLILDRLVTIRDDWYRFQVLSVLKPRLTSNLMAKALAAALGLQSEVNRAKALVLLAPHLAGDLLTKATDAAEAISYDLYRAEALTAVAFVHEGFRRLEVLRHALSAAQAIEYEWSRAFVLTSLAPLLPEEMLHAGTELDVALSEWRPRVLIKASSELSLIFRGSGQEPVYARDINTQARLLAAFADLLVNPELISRLIQSVLARYLFHSMSQKERRYVLRFCSDQVIFSPPVMDAATLTSIANHIREICQEWEWL